MTELKLENFYRLSHANLEYMAVARLAMTVRRTTDEMDTLMNRKRYRKEGGICRVCIVLICDGHCSRTIIAIR